MPFNLKISRTVVLRDVQDFIATNARDANAEVQELVSQARSLLSEKFYEQIIKDANDITNFNSPEFGKLRAFVAENIQEITLSANQIGNIRQLLQGKLERVQTGEIRNLPERITTQNELENAITEAHRLISDGRISLDGGLFEYTMPESLEKALTGKVAILQKYMSALESGINANWVVIAGENNAIELDCQNLVLPDARLEISFRGGRMPEQRPAENHLRCRRLEGNNGYEFYFDGSVSVFSGTIRLTKNRRAWLSPLHCSANLNITANDLIQLVNGQTVTKSLYNNCPGISIRFSTGR